MYQVSILTAEIEVQMFEDMPVALLPESAGNLAVVEFVAPRVTNHEVDVVRNVEIYLESEGNVFSERESLYSLASLRFGW